MYLYYKQILFLFLLKSILYSRLLKSGDSFESKEILLDDSSEVKVEFSLWFKDVYSELISVKTAEKEILNTTYHPGSLLDSASIIFTQFRTSESFIFQVNKNQISRFDIHNINFRINNVKRSIKVFVGSTFLGTFKLKSDVNKFTISTSNSRESAQNNFELLGINQITKLNKSESYNLSIYDYNSRSNSIKTVRRIDLENSTFLQTLIHKDMYILNDQAFITLGNYYDKPYTKIFKNEHIQRLDFKDKGYVFVYDNEKDILKFMYSGGSKLFSVNDNKIDKEKFDTNYFGSSLYFNLSDSTIYRVGGYGQYTFKNDIFIYNNKEHIWRNKNFNSESKFYPRLNSTIFPGKEASFYLFGGGGNKNGHQKFGKYSFKDLWNFDLENKELIKICNQLFPSDFYPANHIINGLEIDNHIYFMTQKNESNHKIKDKKLYLWKFNVSDTLEAELINTYQTDYKLIPNSLKFDKINNLLSFLQLKSNEKHDQLITSVILLPIFQNKSNNINIYFSIISILIMLIIILVFYKTSVTKIDNNINLPKTQTKGIKIISREPLLLLIDGQNINFEASERPKLLKELFLLIISSKNQSINHEKIKKHLWPSVQEKSFINSLNVSLTNLRKAITPYGKDLVQKNKVITLKTKISKKV